MHSHLRVQSESHWGHSCEHLRIATGQGTYLQFGHHIGRPRVIDELSPSTWVKADRPGVQLFARVVYPRTLDAKTGHPVTAIIAGTGYTATGAWQRLTLDNVPRLAAEQARVLRLQLHRDVDVREAYLDLMLLNVYAGSGITNVFVDDLEVDGHLPMVSGSHQGLQTAKAGVQQAQFTQGIDGPSAACQVEQRGAVLTVAGKPLFPRVLQHRGESFEFVKRLGFNAVRISSPPTPWQIAEARRHDLWLVGPPPDVRSGRSIGPSHDRVIAWDLGGGLRAEQLRATRVLAQNIRRADEQNARPLLAMAEEQLRSYSRTANVMVMRRSTLNTTFELADYPRWFRGRRQLLRPGTPAWAVIQTQPSAALQQQAAATGARPPANVDPQQIRLLTYAALSAGARGLLFESRDRLDGNNADSLERAQALELLNSELELIESWLAVAGHVTQLQRPTPSAQAAMLSTQRSHLVLISQIPAHAQHVLTEPDRRAVSLVIPGVPESSDVYRMTPTGLKPLVHRRVTGGIGVALEDLGWATSIVFTSDPLVYARMAQAAARNRTRSAELHLALARAQRRQSGEVLKKLEEASLLPADTTRKFSLIDANLSQAERMLASRDSQAASLYADRAKQTLAHLRRHAWNTVARPQNGMVSPLSLNFQILAEQARFQTRLKTLGEGNRLPGGRMESLDQLVKTGWRHFRREQPNTTSRVDLANSLPNSGQYSLRMEATTSGDMAEAQVESPLVWIRSADVPVRRGQAYIVRGWVRMSDPLTGSRDGLLIYDNMQGPDMALRIRESDSWQLFTIGAVATEDQLLHVNFELTGLGVAFIDDVEIVLENATPLTTPAVPLKTARRLSDLIRLPR